MDKQHPPLLSSKFQLIIDAWVDFAKITGINPSKNPIVTELIRMTVSWDDGTPQGRHYCEYCPDKGLSSQRDPLHDPPLWT